MTISRLTERSVNPPDFEHGDPPEPEPLTMNAVCELADEVDLAIEEIFADRVLDGDVQEIRELLGPWLRQQLVGSRGPVKVPEREAEESC